MTLTLAVDGSALGNPGPAGWAFYLDETTWAAGSNPLATNNQMELQAIAHALRWAEPTVPLHLLCDSQYAINATTKWVHGWRRNNWTTAGGKPVANAELIATIDTLIRTRPAPVTLTWVRGHNGHPLNERADAKARAAATRAKDGHADTFGPAAPPAA